MTRRRHAPRSGFALLAVLWIMVAASALGLTLALSARESVAAARNRVNATEAMWHAQDCLERARAAIGDALEEAVAQSSAKATSWQFLDTLVSRSPIASSELCALQLRPSGVALDVNAADPEMLGRLLRAAGFDGARADSMSDALFDWRDADDVPRPRGAERSWYAKEARLTPRNAPLASDREIALVRGFDSFAGVDGPLTVEPGRIVLARAPISVIAALPGIDDEALARVAERRLHDAWPADPLALTAELSSGSRAALLPHYAELARLTTSEPEAWIVTSRGRAAASSVSAVIEVRLVRAGTRAAIVRRRSWVE